MSMHECESVRECLCMSVRVNVCECAYKCGSVRECVRVVCAPSVAPTPRRASAHGNPGGAMHRRRGDEPCLCRDDAEAPARAVVRGWQNVPGIERRAPRERFPFVFRKL